MAANNFHELPNPHSSVSGVNTSDAGNQKPSRVAEKWRPAGTPVTEPKVSTISRFAGRLIDRLTGKAYSADELLSRPVAAADITDPENIVTNARVVSAIEDDPASARAASNVSPTQAIIHQSIIPKRISEWTFTGGSPAARPLMCCRVGDSFSTHLVLPPNMARCGTWDLSMSSTTGSPTYSTGQYNYWINGRVFNFPSGSSAEFTPGGQANAPVAGDKCAIAYIKEPGAGTILFEAYNFATAAWSTVATIDCSNATTIGAYSEYTLTRTNNPNYKLRITHSSGGTARVVCVGQWDSQSGGAMDWPHGSLSGQTPTQVNSTPSAVFDPIWSGLKPDLVFGSWLDAASEFAAGGGFRLFYSKAQALWASDWLLISPSPTNANDAGTYLPTYESADTVAIFDAQKDWAETSGQSWVDGYSMFGSYAQAIADGNMEIADPRHLSTQGENVRNTLIWKATGLDSLPLGGIGAWTYSAQGLTFPAGTGLLERSYRGLIIKRTPIFKSSDSYQCIIDDKDNPNHTTNLWGVSNRSGVLGFYQNNTNTAQFELQKGWANFKNGVATRVTTFTASGNITNGNYTARCDATAGNMTMSVTSWPPDYPGLIHVIKKIDSSANTVTVDPSGSPTIDDAASVVLSAKGHYIVIQSDGLGNWMKIGGNV